jgi:hypothetical protein
VREKMGDRVSRLWRKAYPEAQRVDFRVQSG